MDNATEFSEKMAQITARAWADPSFKQRLFADPAGVSKEYGIPLPPGMEIKVVEDTKNVRHFVLPLEPLEELSDEALGQVAGGMTVAAPTLAPYTCVVSPPPPPPTCGGWSASCQPTACGGGGCVW